MKNACIVIRNKRSRFSGCEFETVPDALTDAGYFVDKIFILSEEDAHEFAQTVVECKNFFDNVFLVAQEALLSSLRLRVCELWKIPFKAAGPIEYEAKSLFCLSAGEDGAAALRGEIIPYLQEKYSKKYEQAIIRAGGVPSELLQNTLNRIKEKSQEIDILSQERYGDIRIQISYDERAPKQVVDEAVQALAESLNEYIYAIDDTPLNRRIYELLKLRGLKLSIAESFTGGGIASRIIEIPGASDVFYEGVVAYSNASKQRRLGVSAETLQKQGAVSDETAYEMAAGLLEKGYCSVALATTGIAGPSSDNTEKPVGLNYIAAGTSESVFVYKYFFKGGRKAITERAINQALFLLYKLIK